MKVKPYTKKSIKVPKRTISQARLSVSPHLQPETEMEVHFKLYDALSKIFPIVRCVIPFPIKATPEIEGRISPDISVFNHEGDLLFCVEVKECPSVASNSLYKVDGQIRRYEVNTKVKCYLCVGSIQIPEVLKQIVADIVD